METKVEFSVSPGENDVRLVTQTNGKGARENGNCDKRASPKRNPGLPPLFDRCSKQWWNPQMDSEVLEKQSQIFARPIRRYYFKWALIIIMLASISWMIYCGASQRPSWIAGIIWSAALLFVCVVLFSIVQFTTLFNNIGSYLALVVAVVLIATVVVTSWSGPQTMPSGASFIIVVLTIIILHAFLSLPLHITFTLAIVASTSREVVYHVFHKSSTGVIVAEILLLICCVLVSARHKFYLEVRLRSSFWQVGQLITSNLSAEFKKIMIDSIMPKSVSEQMLGQNLFKTNVGSTFRPLYVERMSNVSILYADIVGFTKMSANKSAAELVYLLNDLFRRFDQLCLRTGCEKISTLGDCYYCVSGCPDAKTDHARCCVEMGLGMISAIKEFCRENDVNVDMRIGIHTGIVICGIVGMKRFKFDVWSNDVSFANLMEQWGVPGQIHISEETKRCLEELGHEYEIEDGKIEERVSKEVVKTRELKTFLIRKRRGEDSETSSMSDSSSDSPEVVIDGKDSNAKVRVVTEKRKNKSNGNKGEHASVKKKGVGDVSHDNLSAAVGGAHENVGGCKIISHRNYGHETIQPTHPLLSAKRQSSSSRRHHHSTRNRSKRRLDDEPKMKQVKIYELIGMHGMMPFLDSKVRERQDVEFINSIKDNRRMKGYQVKNLLNPISLTFKDKKIEIAYGDHCCQELRSGEPISSFANMRLSFLTGLVLAVIVLLLVSISSITSLSSDIQNPAWLIVFLVLMVLMIVISVAYQVPYRTSSPIMKLVLLWLSSRVGRHVVCVLAILFPFFAMIAHVTCGTNSPSCAEYLNIATVTVLPSICFSQLNSWIRSFVVIAMALTTMLVIYVSPCQQSTTLTISGSVNGTFAICQQEAAGHQYGEIILFVIYVIVILVINRLCEGHFRQAYHNAYEAEANQNQSVDELLHHIIPPRVVAVIREKKTYSKDHVNVGVVFASITNFNEFYEEQFSGGKECIRILNELIGDVDELLDRKEFGDIEKIKTIGSTFMIAAGLDPNIERDLENHSHLRMLMEFCSQMQKTIQDFSENMVAFTFVLRIGFNHGSVTAGVIGTTKLLYDIWGDTVNIASRMDSTGVPGRIQVSEGSKRCLDDKYEFEHRGSTYVKGKGQMETYLVKSVGSTVDEDKPCVTNYKEYT